MRTSLAICAAVLTLSMSGCSAAASKKPAATPPPPAPNLAKVVPDNYTVTGRQQISLLPGHGPAAMVVTSVGPGMHAGAPVAEGTGDVQVLTYDRVAHRWNIVLDAAEAVPAPGSIDPARPLLDQSATLSGVQARPVWFAGRPTPDLLISARDESANHPVGVVAVVEFRTGTANIVWRTAATDMTQNMTTPAVRGIARNQTVQLSGDYVTPVDGVCCPVRRYHLTLGGTADGVRVVADDRPYLGAWLRTSTQDPAAAVVLGVDPGTAADGVLFPGDVLLGLADVPAALAAGDNLGPVQVDQLARHRAGDHVALRVRRGGSVVTAQLTLGSQSDSGYLTGDQTPPVGGILGVQLDPATMKLADVPAGPSLEAGLQPGDTLLSVNGTQTAGVDDVQAALWGTAGTKIVVRVRHADGTREDLTVTPLAEDGADPASHV